MKAAFLTSRVREAAFIVTAAQIVEQSYKR
jgi:hypothetical protein